MDTNFLLKEIIILSCGSRWEFLCVCTECEVLTSDLRHTPACRSSRWPDASWSLVRLCVRCFCVTLKMMSEFVSWGNPDDATHRHTHTHTHTCAQIKTCCYLQLHYSRYTQLCVCVCVLRFGLLYMCVTTTLCMCVTTTLCMCVTTTLCMCVTTTLCMCVTT